MPAVIAAFKRHAFALTCVIGLAILYLSLSPLEKLPPAPGGDKLHHFIAYAALCFPLAFKDLKLARFSVPMAIAYGGLIELVQPFVNRYGEWADFAANTAGCLIGLGLACVVAYLLPEKAQKPLA